eukprot:s2013_g7.t1
MLAWEHTSEESSNATECAHTTLPRYETILAGVAENCLEYREVLARRRATLIQPPQCAMVTRRIEEAPVFWSHAVSRTIFLEAESAPSHIKPVSQTPRVRRDKWQCGRVSVAKGCPLFLAARGLLLASPQCHESRASGGRSIQLLD